MKVTIERTPPVPVPPPIVEVVIRLTSEEAATLLTRLPRLGVADGDIAPELTKALKAAGVVAYSHLRPWLQV